MELDKLITPKMAEAYLIEECGYPGDAEERAGMPEAIEDYRQMIIRKLTELIDKAEKRAYKQGWDSAGGEALEETHRQEVVVARIETIKDVVSNLAFESLNLDDAQIKSLQEWVDQLAAQLESVPILNEGEK